MRTLRSKQNAIFAIPIALAYAFGGGYECFEYLKFSGAAQRQQKTIGTIITEAGWDHGPLYQYAYEVGSKTRTGTGRADGEHRYIPNERITVYFDRSKPDQSSLVTFFQRANEHVGLVIFSLFGLAALTVFVIGCLRAPPTRDDEARDTH